MDRFGQISQVVDILGTVVTYPSIHSLTDCYFEFVTTLTFKFWLHKELLKVMIKLKCI
jgi:hypothetical protein